MTSPSQAPAPVPDADPVPVAPPSLTTPHPLRGLLLMAGGTLLFACNDSVTKILLDHYDVPVVAAVRYIVHTLLLIAIFGATKGPELYGVKRTGLVAVRSICLAVASLFFGLALQRMPMPETTAIVYIAPLAVVLLAGPLLKETIGPLGWIAAALGFGGMLLIVRPGGGLDPLGVLYAFGNIGLSVAYFMLSRVLAHSERTLALLFYSALAGAIIFGIAAPWFMNGAPPDALQIVLLLSLGPTACLGHFFFTAAYRYAEASMLAPVSYVHLVWAGLLGWLVFGHVPEFVTVIGMVVVMLGGVLVAFRSLRQQVTARRTEQSPVSP